MLLMTVVGGLLMPHINVNTDMTKYLQTDSPMKEGLDKMQESFPGMTLNTSSVRAMYRDLDTLEQAHLADSIGGLPEVAMITSVQSKENYTLFDLSLSEGADPKQVAAGLRSSGREVMVETSIDGNLPDPIVFIIAGVLVFTILFLMCQSWIEPLLFLLCIGIAVIINIGSNALLPSVSMTTNAIVAILQLVLSMDYAIILTNRYRQEKEHNLQPVDAMKVALKNATPSVLSSAFTTIVGMLMLCFMKFRIGLDLGIVLAKGVFCSILCLYTVLPSLIIAFDRVIQKTNKRIFLPPTERLAVFEHRFRIPLGRRPTEDRPQRGRASGALSCRGQGPRLHGADRLSAFPADAGRLRLQGAYRRAAYLRRQTLLLRTYARTVRHSEALFVRGNRLYNRLCRLSAVHAAGNRARKNVKIEKIGVIPRFFRKNISKYRLTKRRQWRMIFRNVKDKENKFPGGSNNEISV